MSAGLFFVMTSHNVEFGARVNEAKPAHTGSFVVHPRAHEMGVIEQYDSEHKRAFYAEVMGDGTDNIHFGKWDGVDTEAPGAYGKAATGMTDWMWKKAMNIVDKPGTKSIKYIDLGSGSGSAAAHICQQDPRVEAMCINLCPNQNKENMDRAAQLGLGTAPVCLLRVLTTCTTMRASLLYFPTSIA
jgi:hypothetical protein